MPGLRQAFDPEDRNGLVLARRCGSPGANSRSSPRAQQLCRTPLRASAGLRSPTQQQTPDQRKPQLGRQRQRQSSLERSEVTAFLRRIGLSQYAELFHEAGFDDMETLLDIEDEHMRDLGILPGHQVKLKKRLDEWEEDDDDPSAPAYSASAPPSRMRIPQHERKRSPVRLTCTQRTGVTSMPLAVSGGHSISDSTEPTDKMITAVQMSWAHLQKIGTEVAGEFFYKKMFELKPETKMLFPMSVRRRYRDWAFDEEEDEHDLNNSPALRRLWGKVIDAVGSAVAGLQDMNKLVPQLTALGMRHVGYGLKVEYFEIAEKVLVFTLREGLGDLYTKEVEFSWTMVYSFISATMICGFRAMEAQVATKQAAAAAICMRSDTHSQAIESMTPSLATETPDSSCKSASVRHETIPQALPPPRFGVGQQLHGGREIYMVERHLQKAIFGDVFEATGLTSGCKFALKVTELEKMSLQAKHQSLCESPLCEIRFAEMMKGLDNVLQMEDTFGDDERHYVLSELASGGDLSDAMRLHPDGFEEDQAKPLVLDAARGLAGLHMRGLAMQDVSLENMLVYVDGDTERWQVRISDPGQAVAFVTDPLTGQEKRVAFHGLVAEDFRPPELYEGKDYMATKVDSWCLGWNTFLLLTAVELFRTSDPSLSDPDFKLLSRGQFSELFQQKGVASRLSHHAKDFIVKLMQIDPAKRLSIKDALWHPWLKDVLSEYLLANEPGELTPMAAPAARADSSGEEDQEHMEDHSGEVKKALSKTFGHLSPVPEQRPKYLVPAEQKHSHAMQSGGGKPQGGVRQDSSSRPVHPESCFWKPTASLLQAAASWSLERLPTLLSSLQAGESAVK